ncbi:MAG: alpha/beta hydrolase family protein [Anaerolineaceae bacterium]|jgi:hypothetical protein
MKNKDRILSFFTKINPIGIFMNLSPAWRGALLAVLLLSLVPYLIQASILFSSGGIKEVVLAGLQFLAYAFLLSFIITLLIHLIKRIPSAFLFVVIASLFLLLLASIPHPVLMLALPLLCVICFSIIGAWISTYISERRKQPYKFQWKKDLVFFFSLAFLIFISARLLIPGRASLEMLDLLEHENKIVETLDLQNPSLLGEYQVEHLTYGAEDTYRDFFNQENSLITYAVDGSEFVKGWQKSRTKRFGFGSDELPLNGQIWYPKAEGRFPLVVIVHGNHFALDYSDPGYAYLGELLASKGYIVASIDENFLNLSFYDNKIVFKPLVDDNVARGWLLLEHIALFEKWNETESTALFQNIDMDNIGLIGHSRGGEAITIATLFNKMKSFPENPRIKFDYNFNIKGIISLAGVDGQYLPGGEPIVLRDVNYLSLQGSHDMDISTYMSYNQYDRVGFSGERDHFKASLYIYGANHGQFNSGWGRNDGFGFGSKILNEENLIARTDQEEITKVLVSAFMDVSLKNRSEYKKVFQNIQYASDWLPKTVYINDYWDSNTIAIADLSEDVDPSFATLPTGTISGVDLSIWQEEIVETKYNMDFIAQNLFKAVNLAWDAESGNNPSYTISFTDGLSLDEESEIVFSVADKNPENYHTGDEFTDFTIELEDRNGNTVRLCLSDLGTLYPMLKGDFTKWPLHDLGITREAVFQSFSIDLARIKLENEDFDTNSIQKISFIFGLLEEGNIYLRNIGFRRN